MMGIWTLIDSTKLYTVYSIWLVWIGIVLNNLYISVERDINLFLREVWTDPMISSVFCYFYKNDLSEHHQYGDHTETSWKCPNDRFSLNFNPQISGLKPREYPDLLILTVCPAP